MTASLKSTLDEAMNKWLEDQDEHGDRPKGLACDGLGEMMATAAASVYEASHAGAVKQSELSE